MQNIKLTIEYDGTRFAGWQLQSNANNTIQEVIEKALGKILKERVRLTPAGRTDAGVHAKGQVANFKTKSKLTPEVIQRALNGQLPKDVVIKKAESAPLNFHARYRATSKSYRYTILNNKIRSPINRHYAAFIPYQLDVKPMQEAARSLVGRHDFRSFQTKVDNKSAVRTIKTLMIKKNKGLIYIDVEGDGFLYNMVRNIVGTLVEVGRGKLNPKDISEILRKKARSSAGPCAPAEGLCLMKVRYDP